MRISDWSSDVCSSDLLARQFPEAVEIGAPAALPIEHVGDHAVHLVAILGLGELVAMGLREQARRVLRLVRGRRQEGPVDGIEPVHRTVSAQDVGRSEEHTSELQSLMRISYAVFCLNKKKP